MLESFQVIAFKCGLLFDLFFLMIMIEFNDDDCTNKVPRSDNSNPIKRSQRIPKTPQSEALLTLCLGQDGEECLEASGKPLHALVDIGQSLQVADVTQDLILGDQLVSEVPGQHLRLLGKGHSKQRGEKGEMEYSVGSGKENCIITPWTNKVG